MTEFDSSGIPAAHSRAYFAAPFFQRVGDGLVQIESLGQRPEGGI
jgi:hypothetical protein